MDSSRLDAAYQALLQAATTAIGAGTGQEPLAWLLSHITLHDGILADAARQIAQGAPAVLDMAASLCADLLGQMVAEHTTGELAAQLEDRAAELVSLIAGIPEERAGVAVRVRLVSRRGAEVFEAPIAWGDLLRVRTDEHLPHYARYIARLAESFGADETCTQAG